MKYQAMATEDLKAVMEEVTRQVAPILEGPEANDDRDALKLLLGSMLVLMSDIFIDMKADEEAQTRILTSCATWFDIGLLMGQCQKKLTDIMDKVNPTVVEGEVPEWLSPIFQILTKDGR